jgi:hypothetical protein
MEQRTAVLMRNGACQDSRIKKGHADINNRFKKKPLAADERRYSMRRRYSPTHRLQRINGMVVCG